MEIWKNIEGYKGYYQISNLGRVKRLDRKINHPSGNNIEWKGRILKGQNRKGYLGANLSKNGVVKMVDIHRIVGQEFIPNPENKPCINHKNGIKADNRINNLEWVTYSENNKHAYSIGLMKPVRSWLGKFGKDHNKSIAVLQYDMKDNFIKEFGSMSEAQRFTGVGHKEISFCSIGKYKQAGGFTWKLKN